MSSVKHENGKKVFWRSLDELEGTPEFQKFVEHEFSEPVGDTTPSSPERRRFMQLMGASFAFAGATGCRWEEDKILPHTRRPDGAVPGVPRFFTTVMDIGGYATGLTVKSFDGRPIKVEGNPNHPDSRGAAGVYHQASLLELYDPDRSRTVVTHAGGQRAESTWDEFGKVQRELTAALRARQGQGFAVLSESSSSPSFQDMKRRLLAAFPQAKWHEYEAISDDNPRAGSQLAFGGFYRPLVDLTRAAVVLSLDADFLGADRSALRLARAFAEMRRPETGTMSRIYAVESGYSPTGGAADHRLPLRSDLVKALAAALDASLTPKLGSPEGAGAPQPRPAAAFLAEPGVQKFLAALEQDLLAHRGRSVVLAGERQPPEVHALAHRLNTLLGNVGTTVSYVPDANGNRPSHADAIKELVADMNGGAVETLLILGGNPVYDAPSDLSFGEALGKVKTSIHLSLFEDETSRACTWHLPRAHYLEAWGDGRGWDGTISIAQPLIAPLHGGKSAIELVAMLLGDSTREGIDIVKRTLARRLGDERVWRRAVHDGVVAGSALAPVQPQVKSIPPLAFAPNELGGSEAQNGQLELVLEACPKLYDGRWANNGWLQELPDPMTKLTWDNAAVINPVTAKALGIQNATLVTLGIGGNSITLPALVSPGQAKGSVRVALGYGRTAAGIVGFGGYLEHGDVARLGPELSKGDVQPVGVNAYALRTTALTSFGSGLQVQPTGKKYRLGVTEHTHAIDDEIGKQGVAERLPALVREATLEEFKKHPDFAKHVVHHPPLLSLWREPVSYDGHKWGMTVDLSKCVGCNACMVACQAENNVPVVGKERVLMGREMHWLRIDRYYKGDAEAPELVTQPVLCMQCENAPCEQVCPVGATMHSREGLNDMVYNRCIGTRYCSNNCPYKVRRFNYFNMNEDLKLEKNATKKMVMNPDVTVRFRGVMEKCTYCVQRIQSVKIEAKNNRRPIQDGEITPACAQTCPTEALVFGDLNDPKSRVARLQNSPRSYAMLQELNVRPRTEYLARVRNPNPELS
jgi:MoCo/4Fe-4S cofactor protein with predicted Tat translocation signal